jgi:hypothetical protein
MDSADNAGMRVEATLTPTTGPHSAVTGVITRAMAGTLVSANRLNPFGWNSQLEKKRLCPWARAKTDHCRYQTARPASVQLQVITEEGPRVHTCHQSPIEAAR